MRNNRPLTPCGITQAAHTTDWLLNRSLTVGSIEHIVTSPFARTLQTALPLAKMLNKTLKVDYLLSEDKLSDGPFRAFNSLEDLQTVEALREVEEKWDLSYGSFPIPTPENCTLYHVRAALGGEMLRKRFPPSSGNVAVFTHGTPAFSLAYALCYGSSGTDEDLQGFIEHQNPIAPAGLIEVVRDNYGRCMTVSQTQNIGAERSRCGHTGLWKCDFKDCPKWYWKYSVERPCTC